MQPCIRIAAWHLHVNAATVRNKNDALSLNPLHYSVFCLSFRPTNSNFSDFFVSGRDGRDGKPGKRSSYLTTRLCFSVDFEVGWSVRQRCKNKFRNSSCQGCNRYEADRGTRLSQLLHFLLLFVSEGRK